MNTIGRLVTPREHLVEIVQYLEALHIHNPEGRLFGQMLIFKSDGEGLNSTSYFESNLEPPVRIEVAVLGASGRINCKGNRRFGSTWLVANKCKHLISSFFFLVCKSGMSTDFMVQ